MCQNCLSSKESNLANTPEKAQCGAADGYNCFHFPCLCIEAPSVLFIILPMTSSPMMSLRDSREVSLKWMDGWMDGSKKLRLCLECFLVVYE